MLIDARTTPALKEVRYRCDGEKGDAEGEEAGGEQAIAEDRTWGEGRW